MNWILGRKLNGGVNHPSTFITKRAYNNWGEYDILMKYNMDMDILYRFYINGAKFKYINEELAVFRTGGVTDTVLWKKKLKERNYLVRKNGGSKFLTCLINSKWVIKQILHSIIVKFTPYEKLIKLKHDRKRHRNN